MIVRPALASDVPSLAALAALTFPLACPPGSTPQDQQAFIDAVLSPAQFAGYLASPDRAVLVATASSAPPSSAAPASPSAPPSSSSDDELLGYTMLVFTPPVDPDVRAALTLAPTVELSKCYVHPAHHGAGVAHALMDSSLAVARSRAAAGIWLGVNQQNARARAFYERSGFAVVGTKHFTVGTRLEDDYVLERPV